MKCHLPLLMVAGCGPWWFEAGRIYMHLYSMQCSCRVPLYNFSILPSGLGGTLVALQPDQGWSSGDTQEFFCLSSLPRECHTFYYWLPLIAGNRINSTRIAEILATARKLASRFIELFILMIFRKTILFGLAFGVSRASQVWSHSPVFCSIPVCLWFTGILRYDQHCKISWFWMM